MSGSLRGSANATSKDGAIIPYRPELGVCLGSMPAAIILVQAMYWYTNNGNKPFYKFRSPCDHKLYKEGDSWTEELGISVKVFDYAWKKLESLGLVSKAVTQDRITYHDIDCDAVNGFFASLYDDPKTGNEGAFSKTTKGHLEKTTKGHLPSSQKGIYLNDKRAFTYTETTTETTSETLSLSARAEKARTSCGKSVPLEREREGEYFDFENEDWSPDERAVIRHLIQPLKNAVKPDPELPHSLALWDTAVETLRCFSPEVLKKACLHLSGDRFIFPPIAEIKRVCKQEQDRVAAGVPARWTSIKPGSKQWQVWRSYLRRNNKRYSLKIMDQVEASGAALSVDADQLDDLMADSADINGERVA